jgi:mRNA interferase RelE/StbE
MRVEYSSDAAKDVAALDRKTAKRIMDKIDWFASQSDPLAFAKPLKDPRKLYRFRIGEYRAIFTIKGQVLFLLVLAIKNRKEAYK